MGESEQSQSAVERFKAELDQSFRHALISYFVRRVGDRAEAEDLTQEVFLRVLRHSKDIDPTTAKAFVFVAAGNLLRDRARRSVTRQKHAHTPLDDLEHHEIHELREEISPERVLVGRETLKAVLLALDGLNQRTRDIFVLYRIEKMKQHEICALYGLSHAAIERHLVKAMTYLNERFERS
jgi:RNA polymerase sigma factor (sigma-70 family)